MASLTQGLQEQFWRDRVLVTENAVSEQDLTDRQSAFSNGVFVGTVAVEVLETHAVKVIKSTGKAGSVCLMRAAVWHGSAPNVSKEPRILSSATDDAEDAIEQNPDALLSTLTHERVRGEVSGRVRCTPVEMQLPAVPKDTSFFAQQAEAEG